MKSKTKLEYLVPVRIVKAEGNIDNANGLLEAKPLQIGLMERSLTTVKGKGYIILDYGKEVCGGARILTFSVAGKGSIRLRFGESVGESCSEIGEKGSTNDHSLRDINTELINYSDMTFCHTGFRFIRVDFLTDATITIKNILASSEIFDAPLVSDYNGNDARVKEIYETARRTIALCAESGFIWDGIKRDRLVWIGDMYPETLSFATCYGRQEVIERSLDFIVDQTPLPCWMNGMPSYSVWWIVILADYYKKVGCKDYLVKNLDYMEALIKQMDAHVGDDGELKYPGLFVDWPTHDQVDEPAGVRALNVIGVKRAIEIFKEFGIDTTVAEKLLKKLLLVPMNVVSAKQVIGLKYFALGEISEDEKAKLVEGGAKGMSTFMSYFILKAIAETSGVEAAVKIMKDYYGAMLDIGATTFFEDFDMDWLENAGRIDEIPDPAKKDIHGDYGKYCYIGYRHSFCHGWSSGVIMFIDEYLNK